MLTYFSMYCTSQLALNGTTKCTTYSNWESKFQCEPWPQLKSVSSLLPPPTNAGSGSGARQEHATYRQATRRRYLAIPILQPIQYIHHQYNTSSMFLSLKSTHIHKGKGATCYLQIIRNPGLLIQMALIEENAQYKGRLTKKNRFYLVLDLPSMYHMQTGNIGNVGGQSGLDKIAPKNEIVFWGASLKLYDSCTKCKVMSHQWFSPPRALISPFPKLLPNLSSSYTLDI